MRIRLTEKWVLAATTIAASIASYSFLPNNVHVWAAGAFQVLNVISVYYGHYSNATLDAVNSGVYNQVTESAANKETNAG